MSNDEYFFPKVYSTLQITSEEWNELNDIRNKLLQPSSAKTIDFKYNPGGIVDTEFAIQWQILKRGLHSKTASTSSMLEAINESSLSSQIYKNYEFIRLFEQLYQICIEASRTKVSINHSSLKRLAQTLRVDDPFQKLAETLSEQVDLLKSLDASY